MYASGGRVNFPASPILGVYMDRHHRFGLNSPPCFKYICGCFFFFLILFLAQERKKPSLNWHPILLSAPPPNAAAAFPTPHPLFGRQHLIKMARKLCPLPRKSVLGVEGGGGESSRLHWDSWDSDLKTTAKWIL